MYCAALHDKVHLAGGLDIVEGVAGDRDEVRGGAGFDSAEVGALQ